MTTRAPGLAKPVLTLVVNRTSRDIKRRFKTWKDAERWLKRRSPVWMGIKIQGSRDSWQYHSAATDELWRFDPLPFGEGWLASPLHLGLINSDQKEGA